MRKVRKYINRRDFIKSTTVLTAGTLGVTSFGGDVLANGSIPSIGNENIIGPRKGFSPHIGTLLSMMTWMRNTVIESLKGLTPKQLDYIHDEESNTIGAMLLHLAATERYYQIHTFEGKKWGDWDKKDKEKFDIAMNLGGEARKTIKGIELGYYLEILREVRKKTVEEFKKRDDNWLMTVDKDWFWGPTNNYCKWVHVCEHESNHNGQIKWISSRLPGK